MRLPLRIALVAAAVTVAVGGPLATGAAAHATLIGTTPASDEVVAVAPDEVVLRFDERVDAGLGGVRVLGPDGERLETTTETSDGGRMVATAVEGGVRGTYTVAYNVVSADGHAINGSYVFHVGAPAGGAVDVGAGDGGVASDVVGALGRWAAFAGTLMAAGALLFAAVVLRDDETSRAALRPLVTFGAVAVVVGSVVALVADAADASGRALLEVGPVLADAATEARFGRLAMARMALAAALLGGATLRWDRDGVVVARLVVGVAAVGLLVVPALGGHAWTSSVPDVAVMSDVSHTLAASAWAGGLVALLIVLPRSDRAGELARRFSGVALGAVALVVVTGSISGYLQVRTVEGLFSTGYGRLLLAKVAGVALLVGLGWVNRRRLGALAARAPDVLGVVRTEVVVAAVVVALTAVLVDRVPPRDLASGPFSTTVMAEERGVQVSVEPARAGTNDVHLYFVDGAGLPAPVDAAELSVAFADVPPRTVRLDPVTADHFSAYGVDMPTSGTWRLQITWVREGAPESVTVEVPIR